MNGRYAGSQLHVRGRQRGSRKDDDAITTVDGLGVLPGDPAIDRYEAAEPGKLRSVVEGLRRRFEIVLVDTGAGLTHESMIPFAATDAVVLVTTPDETAVAATYRSVAEELVPEPAEEATAEVGVGD